MSLKTPVKKGPGPGVRPAAVAPRSNSKSSLSKFASQRSDEGISPAAITIGVVAQGEPSDSIVMTEEMRARFMTLEQLNATLNERVVQLEAEKATLQTRLTSLESATSSFSQLVGRIVALEASAHSKALPPSTTSASIATASTAILSKKILQSANVEVDEKPAPEPSLKSSLDVKLRGSTTPSMGAAVSGGGDSGVDVGDSGGDNDLDPPAQGSGILLSANYSHYANVEVNASPAAKPVLGLKRGKGFTGSAPPPPSAKPKSALPSAGSPTPAALPERFPATGSTTTHQGRMDATKGKAEAVKAALVDDREEWEKKAVGVPQPSSPSTTPPPPPPPPKRLEMIP